MGAAVLPIDPEAAALLTIALMLAVDLCFIGLWGLVMGWD